MLSSSCGIMVRLVAQPVPKQLANSRRNKAKKYNGFNMSKENLALMDWNIYIVNLPAIKFKYPAIVKLYQLRWRIENIFKVLKSTLKLNSIHNVSEHQLRFIILTKMIFFLLIAKELYVKAVTICSTLYNRELSLIQLSKNMVNSPKLLFLMILELQTSGVLSGQNLIFLIKYCCYDKRKRQNMNQKMKQYANP